MKIRTDSTYYIQNGEFSKIENFPFSVYQQERSIYEVLKFSDNSLLYFKEHIARLQKSLQLMAPNYTLDTSNIEYQLLQLCQKNKIQQGNIRIDIFPNHDLILIFFVPHFYPPKSYYTEGVKAQFFEAERMDCQAKTHLASLRAKVDAVITKNNIFECILVNSKGFISEGSRSNLFFIEGNRIFTSPDEYVLPGITRMKLLEYFKHHSIEVIKSPIHKDQLMEFDSCFLSGTSIGALPCTQIEEQKFTLDNALLQQIIRNFNANMNC